MSNEIGDDYFMYYTDDWFIIYNKRRLIIIWIR
jgi:hypothetical protein